MHGVHAPGRAAGEGADSSASNEAGRSATTADAAAAGVPQERADAAPARDAAGQVATRATATPAATAPELEPEPERSCYRKTRYGSLGFAEVVAARVLRERGTSLRAYACKVCGGAHLTHTGAQPVEPRPGFRPARRPQREIARQRRDRRQRR